MNNSLQTTACSNTFYYCDKFWLNCYLKTTFLLTDAILWGLLVGNFKWVDERVITQIKVVKMCED